MAPRNGTGVAALVLGIVALVLSATIFVGLVCGVLAVVFGLIGRARAGRGEATNGGVALAGLITGALGLVISIALVALIAVGSSGHYCVHVGTGPNPCTTG